MSENKSKTGRKTEKCPYKTAVMSLADWLACRRIYAKRPLRLLLCTLAIMRFGTLERRIHSEDKRRKFCPGDKRNEWFGDALNCFVIPVGGGSEMINWSLGNSNCALMTWREASGSGIVCNLHSTKWSNYAPGAIINCSLVSLALVSPEFAMKNGPRALFRTWRQLLRFFWRNNKRLDGGDSLIIGRTRTSCWANKFGAEFFVRDSTWAIFQFCKIVFACWFGYFFAGQKKGSERVGSAFSYLNHLWDLDS